MRWFDGNCRFNQGDGLIHGIPALTLKVQDLGDAGLAAARAGGLSLAVVEATSLSHDIDRPADLKALLELGPETRTAAEQAEDALDRALGQD